MPGMGKRLQPSENHTWWFPIDGGVGLLRRQGTGRGTDVLRRAWRCAATALAAALLAAVPARAGAPAPSHLAVALLIDTSGSMTTNDPTHSRVAAARQVAAALGPGDLLGVVGFGDTVSVLLPLTAMGTPSSASAVDGALGRVGASGATDLLGAITTGSELLGGDANPQDWHVMMLITDGVPDLPALRDPAAAAAYRARMESAVEAAAAHGWVVDTVGLGSGVDAAELAKLASLGDGQYQFAPSAADLSARLLAAFQAARSRAEAAPPPQPPAPPPPPTQITLEPLTPPAVADPGQSLGLPLRARNSSSIPVAVRIAAGPLPPRWSVPTELTVPPGDSVVTLQVTAGRSVGPVSVTVAVSAPPGVTLTASALRWSVRVRPAWHVFLRRHGTVAAEVGVAAALLMILSGYLGYVVRVRPLRRPRGRLEVTAPNGELLASVRLPRRAEVLVGAAAANHGALRMRWIAGEDVLFRIRVEMEAVHRSAWCAGFRAWAHPPQAVVYAEAEWPYHLYPGPRPQRRVDLYDHTAFGAGGLTFTFRSTHVASDREPAGSDLLQSLDR